jgi:hypothetical protein
VQAFQKGIYALECGLLSRKVRTFLEGTEKLFEYDFLSESVRAFPEGISRFLHTENERLDRRCASVSGGYFKPVCIQWKGCVRTQIAYYFPVSVRIVADLRARFPFLCTYRSGNNDHDRGFAFRGARAEPRSAFGLQGLRLFRRSHRSLTPSTPSNA